MCLKDDSLDLSHYVSAPEIFNDSLYKSSRAELKLMTDKDEYLIVENRIRGRMTMASYRYAKSNNLQCPDYDPKILGKVSSEEVLDIQSIAPDAEIGYMLELDLEAPVHLHDYFVDYPLASEKQIIPENWPSLYNERLVNNKEVRNGKYVLEEKLVTKIHSTLKFKQSPWMKDYIEKNIRKRKIAKANRNKDRAERPDIFDLNYSGDLFLMKDETKGSPIGESVCLKPKIYSVLLASHDPKTSDDPDSEDPKKKHGIQKAKGVKKYVVKKELQYDKFLECLRNKKLTQHDMINKIGLNPYDNKRWILLDGIRTLPYRYWRIGLYKCLVASEIALEEAEERAMKVRLRVKE
ncbi:7082_t:CDS:2 [Scutellospora calospora]|uniref:7082_t:CDS:1 n=1 Tax=Scutellospora calospora TaxID=85575 RepID=A0ACA9K1H1_9GLOM|nr:7082_t:CDS:2 [Scutellospora calospora]